MSGWLCSTCEKEFDTRDDREVHFFQTGHGVRRMTFQQQRLQRARMIRDRRLLNLLSSERTR